VGKNKDLDHFLTLKNSITLEHIRDYNQNKRKQKQIFEKLCLEDIFIKLGSPQTFSKIHFISKNLIIAETIKLGLSLLEKYKSALKKPVSKSFKYIFKIKRNKFFSNQASLFILPLTIKDRKKLVKFLSSFGLFQEDKKDYLDFSNFKLLEEIDGRYLEIFSGVFINTIDYLAPAGDLYIKFETALNKFLSNFIKNSRNKNILKLYYGLTAGRRLSLKEISLKYKISASRIEQIIRSSLKMLSSNKEKQQNQQLTLGLEIRLKDKIYYELFSLSVILFAIVFRDYGKVYIKNRTSGLLIGLFLKMMFVFRLLNIPVYSIAKTNIHLFGVTIDAGKKINKLIIKQNSKRFREIIDTESIKKYLSGIRKLFLSSNEINTLSCNINDYLNETSQIREIVFAALKKIGRPAHYSEITKVCSTMFKERVFTSGQIHRSLASKNQQQWVWIGLRGVYALKEWGFIKPDKGLCQTVFEIVNSGFNKTAKPVTLSHIYREIGNYRKMVNENSLYFACNFNPRVKVLKKGMFIPVIKNAGTIEFTKTTSTKDIKFLNDLDKQFRKKR